MTRLTKMTLPQRASFRGVAAHVLQSIMMIGILTKLSANAYSSGLLWLMDEIRRKIRSRNGVCQAMHSMDTSSLRKAE